jgi:hypothetical protein
MEIKMLIISVAVLVFFSTGSAITDNNIRIQVEDVEEADEKWHSSSDPDPLQFKHFEAIVRDPAGKQYAIAASVAGNKYMYEAHAWLANADKWYEIYKATPKMKSKGYDLWTGDQRLMYAGNMGDGWQIKATGDEAAFEVTSKPERPVSQYSVAGSSADFDGYISFRTKVDGKILVDGQSTGVSGFGYCIHTFGNMGKHISWKYLGFKHEELCITAMKAQFDDDQMLMFVTVDGDMKMSKYEPARVSWKEIDQKTWQISATHGDSNEKGNSRQLDINAHLIRHRPTNENQPYSKFSLGFIQLSRTILHEYLADIQVTVTDPDGKLEFQSHGIATEFDLTK